MRVCGSNMYLCAGGECICENIAMWIWVSAAYVHLCDYRLCV